MDVGLLILRIVVGALFVGHGTQKLFGWFGGYGVQGTGGWLAGMGFRPGQPMAMLVGLSEAGGGMLLLLGLLTPIGCAVIVGVMTTAILAAHAEKGMWNTAVGIEFPLVMATIATAAAFGGPVAYSADHAAGRGLAGTGWGVAASPLGLMAGISMNAYRLERLRRTAEAPGTGEERRAA